MGQQPTMFEGTQLWQRTLAPQKKDQHEAIRSRLREAFLSFRRNITPLLENTHASIKDLTVHDISHIDALWQIADQLTGDDYPLTPLEALLLGGAFLLHDAGLALAAYPDGVEELRRNPFWRDSAARILRKKLGRSPRIDEVDNAPQDVVERTNEEALRELHARKAEELGTRRFVSGDRDFYLLEDFELREQYGRLIGRIAKSHWDNLARVAEEFQPPTLGALPGCPFDWTIDPLKVACLLRACDACHVDARRAPPLLHALRKPRGNAELHWRFQGFIQTMVVEDGQVRFSSAKPFRLDDREAWWLGYDLLRQADRELGEIDSLLRESRRRPLLAHSVAGVRDARELARYLKTDGWSPVDTRIRASDVPRIVNILGGVGLYGLNPTVPLRELIQNARDA